MIGLRADGEEVVRLDGSPDWRLFGFNRPPCLSTPAIGRYLKASRVPPVAHPDLPCHKFGQRDVAGCITAPSPLSGRRQQMALLDCLEAARFRLIFPAA